MVGKSNIVVSVPLRRVVLECAIRSVAIMVGNSTVAVPLWRLVVKRAKRIVATVAGNSAEVDSLDIRSHRQRPPVDPSPS
jgi:hypothetical protein